MISPEQKIGDLNSIPDLSGKEYYSRYLKLLCQEDVKNSMLKMMQEDPEAFFDHYKDDIGTIISIFESYER